MKVRMILTALASIFLTVHASTGGGDGKKAPAAGAQAIDVTGRIVAAQTVDLRARVTGYLVKVNFKAGDDVKKDQVLFEIDDRPYRAEVAVAEASLRLAEAVHSNASKTLERGKRLLQAKAISQEDFEMMVAAERETKAKLGVAEAEHAKVRLNLDFTRIRTPLAGKIGEAALAVGNLVKADDNLLASVDSDGPRYVYFDVDEKTATQLGKPPITVTMGRRVQDKDFPYKGEIDFVENRVNPKTGTLRCRAIFPNADGTLMPGMIVVLRVPVTSAPR